MKKIINIFFLLSITASCTQFGIKNKTFPEQYKKFNRHLMTTDPFPISQLPKTVPYKINELSLFADYNSIYNENVIVYLINNTDTTIQLSARGSDIKLEKEVFINGAWKRAKKYSKLYCGNSSKKLVVPANHFILVKGFFSKDGNKSKVRYKLYEEKYSAISNIGLGKVTESMIEFAKYDKISLTYGSFDFIKSVALGIQQPSRGKEMTRTTAIYQLTRFSPDSSIKVLLSLLDQKDLEDDFFDAAYSTLNRIDHNSALSFTKHKLNSEDFPQKHILLRRLENIMEDEFRQAKYSFLRTRPNYTIRNSQLYKKPGIQDTSFMESKKIWLSDEEIYRYFNRKRFDYYDPFFDYNIRIFSYYEEPETENFLKTLFYKNEINKESKWEILRLLSRFSMNRKFLLDYQFTTVDSVQKLYTLPLSITVHNISNESLKFTSKDFLEGLFMTLEIDDIKFQAIYIKDDFIPSELPPDTIEIEPLGNQKFQFTLSEDDIDKIPKNSKFYFIFQGSIILSKIHDHPFYFKILTNYLMFRI